MRLGGSPKISARMKDRCLDQMEVGRGDATHGHRLASLHKQRDFAKSTMTQCSRYLGSKPWGTDQRVIASAAKKFLQREHRSIYAQFAPTPLDLPPTPVPTRVPTLLKKEKKKKKNKKEADKGKGVTGVTGVTGALIEPAVGAASSKVTDEDLLVRWMGGAVRTGHTGEEGSVWSLNSTQRRILLQDWQYESTEEFRGQFANAMKSYLSAVEGTVEVRQEASQVDILKAATVIGCTPPLRPRTESSWRVYSPPRSSSRRRERSWNPTFSPRCKRAFSAWF